MIVGTAAFAEPDALERFAAALGERLVVAVDARERAARARRLGARERAHGRGGGGAVRRGRRAPPPLHGDRAGRDDGGPDLELLAAMRDRSGLPVLAAGGIRSEADLARLAALGLEGAVVGRALLEGAIPLVRDRRASPRTAAGPSGETRLGRRPGRPLAQVEPVRRPQRLRDPGIGVLGIEDVVVEVGADRDRLERHVLELTSTSAGSFASATV